MKRSTKEYIILSLSAVAGFGVLPFTIVRIMRAEWTIFALDAMSVIGCAVLFAYVYKTQKTELPGKILAVLSMVVVTGTVFLKGSSQIMWIYPALTVTFFLLSPRVAAFCSAIVLIVIGVMIWPEVDAFMLLQFYVSTSATLLFSFAFADRTRWQTQKLEFMSTTDPLTKAANRHSMEQKLDELTEQRRRGDDQDLSVILIDLDHFKQVNDTHGHNVGDEVLLTVANILRQRIRSTDSLYRFGGEEFLLLAENTDLDNAVTLAELLRNNVYEHPQMQRYKVTISTGTAQYQPNETTYEWIGRADKALYTAKKSGRNLSCIAENNLIRAIS